jgi:putative ABC transport system ATP-binding protein
MNNLIQFSHVDFTLPNGTNIVNEISFEIKPLDFLILLGSNGSGKSSLIKLMNREYTPSGGEILLEGSPIQKISHQKLSSQVITLTQFVRDSLFLDLTVEENALLIEESYCQLSEQIFSKASFKKSLSHYLKPFNEKLSHSLYTPLSRLSGGEQQILAFALYLKHPPKLLLLDEHTSALDPKTGKMIMEFTHKIIQEKHLTCVMTTHNLDYALEYGNRLLAINHGKIVYDGNFEDKKAMTREKLLEKCY